MNYEEAEKTLKEHIRCSDVTNFKGFDPFCDTSWSGSFIDDFLIEGDEEQYLSFDGTISFSADEDGLLCDVTIESMCTFELFGKDGELIKTYNN